MPLPRPKLPPSPPPLPSVEDLAKRGISFEPVNKEREEFPTRLYHRGVCCGVFPRASAAAHLIRQFLPVLLVLLALMPLCSPANIVPPELEAIAVVEDWRGRRGAAGEEDRYQMLPSTSAAYTGTAEEKAVQHLAWLRAELVRRGVDPSPFNLALCWNAGLRATVTGRAPVRSYDYARRVVAILEARR